MDLFEAREDLIDFLDQEPESVPRFYALAGMVVAGILSPTPVHPTQIMELLWGGDGKTWTSRGDLQRFMDWLTTYWNHIAEEVAAACDPNAPIKTPIVDVWAEDAPDGIDQTKYVLGGYIDWSRGFLRLVDAWPALWGRVLQNPEVRKHMELLRAYAEFQVPANREKVESAIRSGLSLDQAVRAVALLSRPELGRRG